MGESATRFFRDKLSMRVRAREAGLLVPDFIGVLNHEDLHHWMQQTPAPWMLKPRTDASAIGIRKLHKPEELWPLLDDLGDRQSHHLLERFIPGKITSTPMALCGTARPHTYRAGSSVRQAAFSAHASRRRLHHAQRGPRFRSPRRRFLSFTKN